MAEPDVAVLPVGSRFQGRYEIVRRLKAGGMGAVYEVLDSKTHRRRALKVMLPGSIKDADLQARFKLEATITADVESVHVVETFDADIDPATGSPFIVMELLKGEDLSAVLQKRGALPPDEVVLLLGQAALALDKTHAAGIVHRDLKPENLFLTRIDDGSVRIKVLDFGIAKVMADSAGLANTTRAMGTPIYMSKEQIVGDGNITGRADLYALGHLAFALLTGEPYWADEARTAPALYAFLTKVMQGLPQPATRRAARRNVMLPEAFDAWFAQATAVEPGDRFDRASLMIAALARVLGVAVPHPPFLGDHQLELDRHATPVTQISAGIRASDPAFAKHEARTVVLPVVTAPSSNSQGQSTTAAVSSDGMAPRPQARSTKSLLLGAFSAATAVGAVAVAWHLTRPSSSGPSGATQPSVVSSITTAATYHPGDGGSTPTLPPAPAETGAGLASPSPASDLPPQPGTSALPTSSAERVPPFKAATPAKTAGSPRKTKLPPPGSSPPAASSPPGVGDNNPIIVR